LSWSCRVQNFPGQLKCFNQLNSVIKTTDAVQVCMDFFLANMKCSQKSSIFSLTKMSNFNFYHFSIILFFNIFSIYTCPCSMSMLTHLLHAHILSSCIPQLVMGPGQYFVARVGLGKPSLVWV